MRNNLRYLVLIVSSALVISCTGVPKGIEPVGKFDTEKYLGTWYEIARLDHSFERGLSQVMATYSLRDDGGLRVLNKGYNSEENAWDSAEGKAYFVDDETIGHLKVSFFGPFYGSYIVFELDHENYQYAFITSYNRNYLWFLSRTPTVDPQLLKHFLQVIEEKGFDPQALIFVDQSILENNSIQN
ncbi:MAG: lipocalin family protein [Oleibacter sp.]|nr:lipocalin family protein [Thalassolituus sp.]